MHLRQSPRLEVLSVLRRKAEKSDAFFKFVWFWIIAASYAKILPCFFSAGCGRTGTIIAANIVRELINSQVCCFVTPVEFLFEKKKKCLAKETSATFLHELLLINRRW